MKLIRNLNKINPCLPRTLTLRWTRHLQEASTLGYSCIITHNSLWCLVHSRCYFPRKWCHLLFFCCCMHSPLTSSTSTSVSNFPHCPEWVENPRRTGGNVLHSAVGLGTVKAACLTQNVMSCGCTAFWSTEDPVRARSCIYWDGFLHIWWTWVHNGVSVKKPFLCVSEVLTTNLAFREIYLLSY